MSSRNNYRFVYAFSIAFVICMFISLLPTLSAHASELMLPGGKGINVSIVLGNLALVAIAQYATRTDIIIVVEQLCGVGVDDALGVNLVESIVGLVFQSHII